MTDRRTLAALTNAPWAYEDDRWRQHPLPEDGSELWAMWGGEKHWDVGAGGVPVPSTAEIEIARIEMPSPRAVRINLELIAAPGDAVVFTIRLGIGRVDMARVVTLTGPATMDLEVAARFVRVHVALTPPLLNVPVQALAILAPVVPWL